MKYLGVDIGGTNMVAGVVEKTENGYEIISKAECKTNAPRTEDEICNDIAIIIRQSLSKAGLLFDDVPFIGIGSPGSVNTDTGVVGYTNNLYFKDWQLKKLMEERLKKEVYILNDANACAYGEFIAGALKGTNNALAITLGTGIGGGIIINKKLYTGANFVAGEVGHMVIENNGKECSCGRRGCWEAYASATGLINITKEEVMKVDCFEQTYIFKSSKGLRNVDGKTAFDAMKANDELGCKIIKKYIECLGCGLVNVVNIFQPDKICIGGGISRQGEVLLKPLREFVNREKYKVSDDDKTSICVAKLGNDAGIIGAALAKFSI